jgi:hypothetical protein
MIGQPYIWACEQALKGICTGDAISEDKRVCVACREANAPKPVLKDDALYIGDNGRVYHGRCAGQTARYTGRDLRGAKVLRIPNAEIQAEPDLWTCESCEGTP